MMFFNFILQEMMLQICFVDGAQMVEIYIAVLFAVTPFVVNVLKETLILY